MAAGWALGNRLFAGTCGWVVMFVVAVVAQRGDCHGSESESEDGSRRSV